MFWPCADVVSSSLSLLRMDSHPACAEAASGWSLSLAGIQFCREESRKGRREDVSDACVGLSDCCSGRERKSKQVMEVRFWNRLVVQPLLGFGVTDVSSQTSSDAVQEQTFSWMWCLEEIFLFLDVSNTLWAVFSHAVPNSTVAVTSRKGPHFPGRCTYTR